MKKMSENITNEIIFRINYDKPKKLFKNIISKVSKLVSALPFTEKGMN